MADDAAIRPITAAELRRVAEDPGRLDLVGAPEGFDALAMADIVKARKGLSVFVARDGARLSAFTDAFRFFAPQVEVQMGRDSNADYETQSAKFVRKIRSAVVPGATFT